MVFLREKIAGFESAAEKLLAMIETHFLMLSQDQHLGIVTQLEIRQSNKELRLKINDVLKGYLKVIERILIEGKENGEFPQDLDVRLARQMIFGTLDETITTWVMNDQKYDLTKLAPTIYKLLLHGCAKNQYQ